MSFSISFENNDNIIQELPAGITQVAGATLTTYYIVNGQLLDEKLSAIESVSEIRFTSISAGEKHFLALDERGQVWTWSDGNNSGGYEYGQLGRNNQGDPTIPGLVEFPDSYERDGDEIVKIQAGGWHCLALGRSGKLYGWGWTGGRNTLCFGSIDPLPDNVLRPHSITVLGPGQLPEEVVDMFSMNFSWSSAIRVRRNDAIYVAGYHSNGSVGVDCSSGFTLLKLPFSYSNVFKMVGNGWASFILTNEGEIYSTGPSNYNGTGINKEEFSLIKFDDKPVARFVDISCGYRHTLFLDEEGNILTAPGDLSVNDPSKGNFMKFTSEILAISKVRIPINGVSPFSTPAHVIAPFNFRAFLVYSPMNADEEFEFECCSGCGDSIISGAVELLDGSSWHKKCIKCKDCGKEINSEYKIFEGVLRCVPCYRMYSTERKFSEFREKLVSHLFKESVITKAIVEDLMKDFDQN